MYTQTTQSKPLYDCIIVGGGLAGLSLSILLSKAKKKVLLLEKKKYPYHKVCGEYISMESWHFLERLGVPLSDMALPKINQLKFSDAKGNTVNQKLDLGGFGISRYTLDACLADIAVKTGVELKEETTAVSYKKINRFFYVQTNEGEYCAPILCGSFGKHSFGNFHKQKTNNENWVGIKYHIKLAIDENEIALHNFEDGYCGMSRIEEGKTCLCYLVKSSKLKEYKNDISLLEREVLYKNPFLKQIFSEAKFIYEKPLAISNVDFSVKKSVHDNVFYLGDAAGTIAPLCGNGMSNAMRSAFLLSGVLLKYFDRKTTLAETTQAYQRTWHQHFNERIQTGKFIQHFFCKKYLTSLFVHIVKWIKPLRLMIIKRTHGKPF